MTIRTSDPTHRLRAATGGILGALALVMSTMLFVYAISYFRQAREGDLPRDVAGDGMGALIWVLAVLTISFLSMVAAWGFSIYAWKQHRPWVWMWLIAILTTVLIVVFGGRAIYTIVWPN